MLLLSCVPASLLSQTSNGGPRGGIHDTHGFSLFSPSSCRRRSILPSDGSTQTFHEASAFTHLAPQLQRFRPTARHPIVHSNRFRNCNIIEYSWHVSRVKKEIQTVELSANKKTTCVVIRSMLDRCGTIFAYKRSSHIRREPNKFNIDTRNTHMLSLDRVVGGLASLRRKFAGEARTVRSAARPRSVPLGLEELENRLVPTTAIIPTGPFLPINPVPGSPAWFQTNMSDPGVHSLAQSDYANHGSLTRTDLILLMDTPEGRVGACPKSVRDQGVTLVSAWDFQEGRTFQPRCGLRPPPIPPEYTMRFYNQQHQFYCGIDLHARTPVPSASSTRPAHVVCRQEPRRRPQRLPRDPRALPRRTSSSASSACSPGTGSPTSAPRSTSPSSSATPCT